LENRTYGSPGFIGDDINGYLGPLFTLIALVIGQARDFGAGFLT
jgi:hypothetical protein